MENPEMRNTVRSQANSLAKKAQELKEAIQKNNALKSVDTQLIYQEGHDLPFTGPRLRGWHQRISIPPSRLLRALQSGLT